MLIYIALASLVFWGGFTKQARYFYKGSLIALFILTAFRRPDWGGFDSTIYMNFFARVPLPKDLPGFQTDYGIGYIFLNSFSKTIVNNYIFFQALLAAITMVLLHCVIEKAKLRDSEKCFFVFSYFCYRFMWNTWVTYRQNIANLIFWLFVMMFWQRRRAKENIAMAGGVVAASLFHSSAWVNLLSIPCDKLIEKWSSRKRAIVISAVSVFLWLFGGKVFSFILNLAISRIDSRYSMYAAATIGTSNVINYVFRLAVFLWMCLYYDHSDYEKKNVALSTLSIMVILGSISSELMLRIYEYYAIGLYLALATCLREFKGKNKAIAAVIFFVVMMIIFIRGTAVFGGGVFANYQSSFGMIW